MKIPGPIALRAVLDAEANVGVHEQGGNNRGQYVETYLAAVHAQPGDPWCAAFVSYRLQAAARELGKSLPPSFPLSAWTPDYKTWAIKQGLWIPLQEAMDVQRGDLACFYFSTLGRIGHIGIVRGREPSYVLTVEGNTGSGEHVNREGDGVYARNRLLREFGQAGGFVRLPW